MECSQQVTLLGPFSIFYVILQCHCNLNIFLQKNVVNGCCYITYAQIISLLYLEHLAQFHAVFFITLSFSTAPPLCCHGLKLITLAPPTVCALSLILFCHSWSVGQGHLAPHPSLPSPLALCPHLPSFISNYLCLPIAYLYPHFWHLSGWVIVAGACYKAYCLPHNEYQPYHPPALNTASFLMVFFFFTNIIFFFFGQCCIPYSLHLLCIYLEWQLG